MQKSNCGSCGMQREDGDVCCEAQARNQGQLHATCNHDRPPMRPEWVPIYDAAAKETIDAMNTQSEE